MTAGTSLRAVFSAVFRGIAQIFFIPNWLTGLFIVVGMAVFSPVAAAFLLLGSVAQNIGAWAAGMTEEARQGLMGFNGALVGVAAWAFAPDLPTAAVLTVLGALAAVAVHRLVDKLFSAPGLPVSTAPFCLIASAVFAVFTARGGELSSSSDPLTGLALGVANSFSEVVLADGWITGLLIFLGLLVGSRMAAACGLLGAVVGVLVGVLVGGVESASTGLHSYSAVLAAMALGAIFWTTRSPQARMIGALTAAAASVGVTWVMVRAGGPVFTWPFLISMWTIMAVGLLLPGRRKEAAA